MIIGMIRSTNTGKSKSWRNASAAAILCLLSAATARSEDAPRPGIAPAWRDLFKRTAPPPPPADNETTPGKIALGARLFADPRLSGKGDRTCATCHVPDRAFTDSRQRALGLRGASLPRNSPSLFNLAWSRYFFWDGRAASLEVQVQGPILAANEMAGHWPSILQRLERDLDFKAEYQREFPTEPGITEASVVKALAAYVRSIVSPRTRFDEWVDGKSDALNSREQIGFELFAGKAGCVLCHVGWRFTDDRLHDIGLPGRDPGQGAVAGGTRGLAAFKTPGLREIARTAPYMHDGSLPTLAAVVAHYAGGFLRRPSLSTNMNRKLRLNPEERADLIAFLGTLSSETTTNEASPIKAPSATTPIAKGRPALEPEPAGPR